MEAGSRRRSVSAASMDYIRVTPEAQNGKKQKEGTYRYDCELWKDIQPPHNPWLVHARKQGRGLHFKRAAPRVDTINCGGLPEGVRHAQQRQSPVL
jgi:hypothetical protein